MAYDYMKILDRREYMHGWALVGDTMFIFFMEVIVPTMKATNSAFYLTTADLLDPGTWIILRIYRVYDKAGKTASEP